MMEFAFEPSGWELEIESRKAGGKMPVKRLLALLEGEDEETVQEAFSLMEREGVALDISGLPKAEPAGDSAARLKQEAERKADIADCLGQNDPLRLYLLELEQIRPGKPISALAEDYLAGDPGAMEDLSEALLPQVVQRAMDYTGWGVLLLDLIQEGSLALWQGLGSYTGGDVVAHCREYMDRAMAKAVFLQARAGGVGQKLRRDTERFARIDKKLLTDLGRNPTVEEIALEMGISPEEADSLRETLTAARQMQRAKQAMAPKEESPDDEQAVENTAYFQSRQRVGELLAGLSGEDERLLTLRFGLDGALPLSPEETGRKLGITPDEVIRREEDALRRLRQKS